MQRPSLPGYLELARPRIALLVVLTAAAGYYLAGHTLAPYARFARFILGTLLACCGSSALNQYLERDYDALMSHAKDRPIPAGEIPPLHALNFGVILVIAGVGWLSATVNPATGFIILLASFVYILVYTPMKRLSPLSTSLGAVAGSLPPVAGWAASSGQVGVGAWLLFLILFIWQHPHFYAIALMFRDDYRRAGFKTLPAIDAGGNRTALCLLLYSLALIPASLSPSLAGLSGSIYGAGAVMLGLMLLVFAWRAARSESAGDARVLLKASIAHLSLLTMLMYLDGVV
jgi:heme o synthase